jgi:hypothetical protein
MKTARKKKAPEKKSGFGFLKGKTTLLILILFFILTIGLFRDFVFSGQMLYGTDTISAGVMFRSFYASFVKEYHSIPMWNPYLFGGLPFVDAMHGDTFYPLALLQFIIPIHRALGWKLIFTVFLAGIFMYLCMRTFKFSQEVSIFSALAYMFSANLVSWVYAGHDGRMYITSLLPLLILLVELAVNSKKFIHFLLLGGAIGLLILANHPQLAYYASWATGLYFLFRLIFLYIDNKEEKFVAQARPLVKPIILFVFAVLMGLGLSLVQILPTYIYVNKYSPRAGGAKGYNYSVSWSNHPEEVVSQVVPEFCGYNVGEENSYWGRNPFKLNSDYAGIIPLFFALLALFFVRDRKVWFFFGLGILALIFSLGGHTPIFKLFYYFVPQIKNMRAPSLIMFLLVFSTVFLGATGLEYILKRNIEPSEQKRLFRFLAIISGFFLFMAFLFSIAAKPLLSIWTEVIYTDISPDKTLVLENNIPQIIKGFWLSFLLVGAVSFLTYFLIKGKIKSFVFILLICLLGIIDLWRVDSKFIRNFDSQRFFAKDDVIDYLQKQEKPFRVMPLPGAYPQSNLLAMYDIEELFGQHGNQLRTYDEFTERRYYESARNWQEYSMWLSQFLLGPKVDLLNTKYILSKQSFSHPKFEQVYQSNGLFVMKNLGCLPRARVVFKYEIIKDDNKILERIMQPDFDYRNSVILQEEIPNFKEATQGDLAYREIKILDNRINSFQLEANPDKPGILVLSENYYPAWKVYVDGKQAKIYRADYLFRAIYLNRGKHKVKFVFDSALYKIGRSSTLSTCLVLLVIFNIYLIKGYLSKKVLRNQSR